MEHYYVREYIPGYTGHIPAKMGTFAVTAGRINRQLVINTKTKYTVPLERQYYTRCITHLRGNGDKDKYGYRSRHGISWIAGPTNNVYAQHIPCIILEIEVVYQGYVHSIVPENIMGKSFARCTETAIGRKKPPVYSAEVPLDKKYTTTYTNSFSEKRNRRFCNILNFP